MKLKMRLLALVLTLFLLSCKYNEYSQYIDKKSENRVKLEQLFPLLDKYTDYSENRFTVISEIITNLIKQNNSGSLNLFINSYIQENPDDPYNAYYILNLASYYLNQNNTDFAKLYLRDAVLKYKDLIIKGESIHFKALEILVNITSDSDDKIFYYNKIITEHSDSVIKSENYKGGIGEIYYYLGKSLEKSERWDEAIAVYEKYLKYTNVVIKNDPTAREITQRKVGFYHSNKKWVHKDLDTLLNRIKYAIAVRNPQLLDNYRAFDFFIINWKSKYSDLISSYPMESSVLTSMSIRTSKDLDPMSNENEAYLSVWGNNPWSNGIWLVYPTWYFYFKKVDYPMDPEINGGWEWAGIYLGEKL